MKPGDKFPVNLEQWQVAEAVVVDIEDGKVTLDIPPTRIVMGVKTSLTDIEPAQPSTERVIVGVEPTPAEPKVSASEEEKPAQPTTQSATQSAATVANDAVGDGLSNYALPEME